MLGGDGQPDAEGLVPVVSSLVLEFPRGLSLNFRSFVVGWRHLLNDWPFVIDFTLLL